MKKKRLKSAIVLAMPIVAFLLLGVFLVSGLSSGYVFALSGNGGGLFVGNHSSVKLKNGTTISGNSATNGGGVYVSNGGTFTMGEIVRFDEDGNPDENGEYVHFGSYPQTYQSDTSVITNTTDENGYYIGTDGTSRYAKVESASPYKETYVFDDETTIVEGETYYFKVEPIKWRILKTENGKALLFCENIIDKVWFDDTTSHSNNYANSEIRAYLNGYSTTYGNSYYKKGFLQTAFTTAEQKSILTTEVDNTAGTTDSSLNEYICENTNDKIFLLSYQDLINTEYGFSSLDSENDPARRKKTTDLTRAKGVYYYSGSSYTLYNGYWWLRSPSSEEEKKVCNVINNGRMNFSSSVYYSNYGVVPALYVDMDYFSGATISGNTATSGNGNDVYNAGTFTMNSGTIGTGAVRVDENGNPSSTGNYVLFGSYPKTYQADTSVITSTQDSNGYYIGTDGISRYALLVANPYVTGDAETYQFSDGTKIVSGTSYYFKVEPIKWRILEIENGKALLFCDEIITAMWFDDSTSHSNNYAESEIRAYLNGYSTTYGSSYLNNGFLQTAFTTVDQSLIVTTEVDNTVGTTDSSSNEYICENTNDKIFLLSYQDLINTEYGFSSSNSEYDTARQKQTTDYARANNAYYNTSSDYLNNGWYWLRSPVSSDFYSSYFVNSNGFSSYYSYVSGSGLGVVPALYVSASAFEQEGYGIYNEGTMNLFGGTVYDDIYSETSFNTKMNASIKGTIVLGDNATISVLDYDGTTPNYNIVVSSLRENGTILILKGSSTTPDLTNIVTSGFDTDTKEIVSSQNSNGEWEIGLVTKQYRVSLSCGEGISSVSGSGLYDYGSQVQISAVVSEGYSWAGWTGSSAISSQTATIVIGISDVSFTATATINQYSVTLSKGTGISSVSGAGKYDYGSQIQISAVVSEGYSWSGWTGSSAISSQTATIVVGASDISLTATATINQYSIVLSKGEGVSLVSGSGTYDYGTQIEIDATVSSGYVWSNWSGSMNLSEKKATITVGASDINLTANATPQTFEISVDGGSVNNSSYATSSSSQTRTLTSSSKTGYNFSAWSVSFADDEHSSVNPSVSENTLTIPAGVFGNISVVALWTANTYVINLDANGGTITNLAISSNSSGLTIKNENSKLQATYDQIGIFTATIKKDGYTFNGWSCNGGGTISNLSTLPTDVPKTSVKNLSSKVNGSVTLTAIWKENFVRVDASGNEDEDGSFILFGSYPKTIKSSSVTIDTSNVDENGYYLGSDGERYASLVANVYTDEWSGTYYFSNGQVITTGTTYYFKVEPIKWRILTESNGTAFIVATDFIDSRNFDDEYSSSNNYANSEIRAWLNGYSSSFGSSFLNNGFLQNYFTSSEQSLILTTTVDNSASTTIDAASAYVCANTNDKIFLLSYADVTNSSYGFSSDYSVKETIRQRIATDWARANYSFLNSSYGWTGYWWTRSPSSGGSSYVIRVNYAGYALSGDYATSTIVGVVPAMRISGLKAKTSSFASSQKLEKEQENSFGIDESVVSKFVFNVSPLSLDADENSIGNIVLKNQDLYFEKNKKGFALLSIFDEKILLKKSQESEPVILSLNLTN